jgi:predicted HAD superfamily Cof-like phosphohydrolase
MYRIESLTTHTDPNQMNQTHPMELVREFMRTFQQYVPSSPVMPDPVTQNLRYRLIDEEAQELNEATDKVEYLDAIGDLLYVVYGAALAAGFSPHQVDAAFCEIHRSNMSKCWSDDETDSIPADCRSTRVGDNRHIVRRSDGKIVKSPSYSPARLEGYTR